jgi:Fe-S-cluster containining protein
MESTKAWWSKGVRFQCQGSGKCCVSRGEYGFVFLTLEDRRDLARHLGLRVQQFTRLYCTKTDGAFHLKEDAAQSGDCLFLKNKQCGVYEGRPMQCRTWPFWPETMSARAWNREVASFCPGVGKGPLIRPEAIEQALYNQQLSTGQLAIESVKKTK